MISKKYHFAIARIVKKLQRFTNRFWFPPLISLLALLDVLIIIIPTEGILISSILLKNKRWITFALSVAIGSTIGSVLLINLIEHYGLQEVLKYYPSIDQTLLWKWTLNFFNQYGLLVVFLIGITPLTQQPVLIFAALSKISFPPLIIVILISRIIKFGAIAYIASHAPRMLSKFWGIQNEIKDAGIEIADVKITKDYLK